MNQETPDLSELIEYVTRALVDNPDEVEVTAVQGEKTTVYELRVNPQDLGKIIGKQGRTIRAIRTILAASSLKSHQRAVLEVLE